MPQYARVSDRRRSIRIIARSMFREMTAHGYQARDVVGVATALIDELTIHLASHRAAPSAPCLHAPPAGESHPQRRRAPARPKRCAGPDRPHELRSSSR